MSILAGDLHEGIQSLPFVDAVARERPAIVVLGNHEFYGSSLVKTRQAWRAISKQNPNIIFLDNDVWEYQGVRYIGATLWTDFNGENPLSIIQGMDIIKDYIHILNDEESGTTNSQLILEEFRRSKAFISTELSKPFDGMTVVITHHAPSYVSVPERWKDSPHNYLFCSDLDALILYNQIDLLVHGHIHKSVDTDIGGRRIICNPRGTPSFQNEAFDPGLVISLTRGADSTAQ
ncbi:metallophosphoesterase [Pseudomonas luteola]